MDYIKVFDEIVDIMHNDYSGCNDKRGWDNPDIFRQEILSLINHKSMSKRKFYNIIERYLLLFKDYHINFAIKGLKRKAIAINVRRYQDALYVTESNNPEFKKGDIIVKLGKDSIFKVREKHKNYFFESEAEREDWYKVLRKYKTCYVLSPNGQLLKRQLKHMPDYNYYETLYYQARKINQNTLYIKLPHFCDDEEMKKLINDNRDFFENCKNLIVDVRVNIGGNDTTFFPLLKYILPDKIRLSSLLSEISGMTINYTKRNCDGRIEFLSKRIKKADEATQKHLTAVIADLRKKSGKGFLAAEQEKDDGDIFDIEGQALPRKVIVLSDFDCGSSGDSFVEICKMSDKVTVIGRPTMGITDYSNLNTVELDGLTLYYPTSREDTVDKGKGLNGKGVPVNTYIPWTPAHLEKDIDLEYALEYLDKMAD